MRGCRAAPRRRRTERHPDLHRHESRLPAHAIQPGTDDGRPAAGAMRRATGTRQVAVTGPHRRGMLRGTNPACHPPRGIGDFIVDRGDDAIP
jgi:hypothetical protein